MHSVMIREFLEQPAGRPEAWSTGFPSLDSLVGGFRRGQLWVITGAPSTGKSLLLTQLVHTLAVEHAFTVEYHCARVDDPALTRSRLLSLAVKRAAELPELAVPLDDLPEQRQAALEALKSLQLNIYTGGGFAVPSWTDARTSRRCLAVDDPEGKRGPVLDQSALADLRTLVCNGAIGLVTVPRSHCIHPQELEGSLREEWSSVADFIVEISENDVGSSVLHLRQNRRGPRRDIPVISETHWGRLVERASS